MRKLLRMLPVISILAFVLAVTTSVSAAMVYYATIVDKHSSYLTGKL